VPAPKLQAPDLPQSVKEELAAEELKKEEMNLAEE
jgi:hypothetical protein